MKILKGMAVSTSEAPIFLSDGCFIIKHFRMQYSTGLTVEEIKILYKKKNEEVSNEKVRCYLDGGKIIFSFLDEYATEYTFEFNKFCFEKEFLRD